MQKHVDSKHFILLVTQVILLVKHLLVISIGLHQIIFLLWSIGDAIAGNTAYLSSVGSTVSNSSYGAQYRTSVLKSNFGYSSNYTSRDLVRLTASDAAGNSKTQDVLFLAV